MVKLGFSMNDRKYSMLFPFHLTLTIINKIICLAPTLLAAMQLAADAFVQLAVMLLAVTLHAVMQLAADVFMLQEYMSSGGNLQMSVFFLLSSINFFFLSSITFFCARKLRHRRWTIKANRLFCNFSKACCLKNT